MAGRLAQTFGPQRRQPNPVEDMYKLYNTSVKKQAGDYDDIMSRFKNIFDMAGREGGAGSGFQPYTPDLANYSKSDDTTRALGFLRDLSETGGLSGADQQNLRARGVSPIRSMYATAQRDMDRRRRLAGGYSPNYGAVTARFARDQSSLIADQLDKVNANIAEMVQRGKLASAPEYAGAAQRESELANKFELENAAAKNEAKRFNLSNMFNAARDTRNDRLAAAKGMTDLYGTTPALSSLYGTQSLNTAQFQNNVNQQKKRNAIDLFGRARG